jgi:hypothetical protein
MVNYENSVIYKIYCKDENIKDVYVGSTTNFQKRKWAHKTKCCNTKSECYNRYVYKFIRENGNWENWNFEILEKVKCKDIKELHLYERKWFDKMNSTLNCDVPNRTRKEWRKDNRDRLNKKKKEYYQKNKHKNKEYYEKNKEVILKKRYEKVICEKCGFISMKQNLKRHQKSRNCKRII